MIDRIKLYTQSSIPNARGISASDSIMNASRNETATALCNDSTYYTNFSLAHCKYTRVVKY